jgi:vacuolar protein sorting-associated protein 8
LRTAVKEAGTVTALSLSSDHAFVAVGHATGFIHIYDLSSPTTPARSAPPVPLPVILQGRGEGHLPSSPIVHLGFVAARHTAIVSSDENGLAFYQSLGKVLGLANTNVIRILGRYPQQAFHSPRPILAMAPLPLGLEPHVSDKHSLVALLTATKLIIAGLKPSARTWWRFLRPESDGNGSCGALAWFPSGKGNTADPILAFSWDKTVRFVHVRSTSPASGSQVNGDVAKTEIGLGFDNLREWKAEEPVRALQWMSQRVGHDSPFLGSLT